MEQIGAKPIVHRKGPGFGAVPTATPRRFQGAGGSGAIDGRSDPVRLPSRRSYSFFDGRDTPEPPAGGLLLAGRAGPDPLPVTERGRAPSEERFGRAPLDSLGSPLLSLGDISFLFLDGVVDPFNYVVVAHSDPHAT